MPYINHPARQDDTATVMDWIRYRLSQWMLRRGAELEHRALYPGDVECPDCGQWMRPGTHCDHIPF